MSRKISLREKILILVLGFVILVFSENIFNAFVNRSGSNYESKELKVRIEKIKSFGNRFLLNQEEKFINEIKDLLRVYLVELSVIKIDRIVKKNLC